MICFPNAKINIGLFVTGKRDDGFHNIETLFYPVPLCDALEIFPSEKLSISQSGSSIPPEPDDNLVIKAYREMQKKYNFPPVSIFLKKAIPSRAGLGGGSADAAFMLKSINRLYNMEVSEEKLEEIASSIGADCPFFIKNRPVVAVGTGNVFTHSDLSLKGYTVHIVKPPVEVSTMEAYSMIKPMKSSFNLEKLSSVPVSEWKNVLKNDFEPVISDRYPIIKEIKDIMYEKGAEFASMSGSGSAVYGLFKKSISPHYHKCFVWKGTLG
ncbi:MAG: 4-(cytidine 5'-diphospho)-2-C-methyl-D-erythritol kinase [Tannerella sp.]|jgi:4-diphosphocytidyl-2-C-methyl-D-erythritol kinase|nr:4-(cytidine 5'-diphospho)-2-C-methyl-D-erythritol kinase [Tannerella sp.]